MASGATMSEIGSGFLRKHVWYIHMNNAYGLVYLLVSYIVLNEEGIGSMHYKTPLVGVENDVMGHHRTVHVIAHVEVDRLQVSHIQEAGQPR